LAAADGPLTVIEVAQALEAEGMELHDDRVRNALNGLEHNEGIRRNGVLRSLAARDGKRGRSDLWCITPAGREEHARAARTP
jgi:hypothetical protein